VSNYLAIATEIEQGYIEMYWDLMSQGYQHAARREVVMVIFTGVTIGWCIAFAVTIMFGGYMIMKSVSNSAT